MEVRKRVKVFNNEDLKLLENEYIFMGNCVSFPGEGFFGKSTCSFCKSKHKKVGE